MIVAASLRLWGIFFIGGLAALVALFLFLFFIFLIRQKFIDNIVNKTTVGDGQQSLAEVLSEVLAGRAHFWTTYGQYLVSTLVVALVAILILANVIRAEAGLPIISAVLGVAVGRALPQRPGRREPAGGGGR